MNTPSELSRLKASLAGRYSVLRELGAGGMATVFLATDDKLDRPVALKVLRTEFAQALGAERFLREIRIAARLDHANILALYDSGAADGFLYYVMPFVDGESLRDRITRAAPLALEDAIRLVAQIADALDYAHQRGIVHRDIKPENVLISDNRVKVADFGIALAMGSGESKLTQTGLALGTPAYMSPEQIMGESDIDGRSDLYSLGCVLFEMLSGSLPFAGANAQAQMARRFTEDPPRVSTRRPAVPPMVDLLLARALARDPSARQATIREFREALLAELSGSSVAVMPMSTNEQKAVPHVPLIGREGELGEARRGLSQLAVGKGGILLIGGEAGVGKTRLSASILEAARAQGALCVIGHCHEMDGATPFAPFAEILDSVARLVPLEAFREVLGDSASEIARIQPSLRQMFPDIPAPFELAPDQQRRYLFARYRAYVERSCKVAPIVMLLDDVHWGDAASLSLLEHIAGYVTELPLFIIATFRDAEIGANAPFAAMLESFTRHRLATRQLLRRLDERAVADLLAALGGSRPPASLVGVIFAETEGNPFFVEEVFQHLREEGRLFDSSGAWRTGLSVEELDVPESVRLVVGRRLDRLPPICRQVLTAAAVIGNRFELSIMLRLGEFDEDDLIDALDTASSARLVEPQRGGREVAYAFNHELIRQTLLASLSEPRRQRRHLKTASAIQAALGSRVAERAADLAHHLFRAGASADPDQTVRVLTLAAEQAVDGSAFAEALAQCDRAATVSDVTDVAITGHLLRVRGAALKGLGEWPVAVATLASSLEALRRGADAMAAARVALDLAWLMAWAADNQRVHDACIAALADLPETPSAERVRLMTLDAWAVGYLSASGYGTGIRGIGEARTMATTLRDERQVGFAYHAEAVFQLNYGRMDACVAAESEAIPRLDHPGDVQWRIEAAGHQVLALTWSGQWTEADRMIDDVMRVSRDLGNAGSIFQGALAIATAFGQRTGDLDGLEERLREITVGMPSIGPYAQVAIHPLAMSMAERGDRETALQTAQHARRLFPPSNQWSGLFAGVELWCMAVVGHEEWETRLEACIHFLPEAGRAHFIGSRWFAMYLLLAYVERGALVEAAALYDVLKQALDEGLRVGPLQPVEALAGLAAAAGNNWQCSEQHFRAAFAFADRNGDRLGRPFIQKWYAWMLLRRNAPEDRQTAIGLLDECIAGFDSMGMQRSSAAAASMKASRSRSIR